MDLHCKDDACAFWFYNPLSNHYRELSRLFDRNDEKSIAEYLIENYIKQGYFFTDEDFKDIAYMAWQEKYWPLITSNDPETKLESKLLLTWSQVNVDQNPRQSALSDKEQITVLATITAAKTKLQLLSVSEGLSEQVEKSQIGDVDYHWTTHTENGWINEESFIKYLKNAKQHFFLTNNQFI